MQRKATMICYALVAWLAIAVLPASASAENELYSGATKVPVGTQISGSTYGPVWFENAQGTVMFECSGAELSGSVHTNGPFQTRIDMENIRFTGQASEKRCETVWGATKLELNTPGCLKFGFGTLGKWRLNTNDCSQAAGASKLTYVNWVGTCRYTRTTANNHLSMSSEANTEPLRLATDPEQWYVGDEGNAAGCFGAFKLHTTFELETAAGADLKLVP